MKETSVEHWGGYFNSLPFHFYKLYQGNIMAMVVSQSYIKYHSEYHPILLRILGWKWTTTVQTYFGRK